MARETQSNFISYARADSAFALKLANTLRVAHANIWIDQLDIPAGNRWDVAIEKALKETNNLIVVLTRAAVSSINVMDEVSYALEVGKTIFPILLEECDIPFRLRRFQFIDFTAGYEKGLTKLLTALGIGEPELPKRPEIDKADIGPLEDPAQGRAPGALTGDFQSRWHWISGRQSAENNEISVLAIIETVIAGALAYLFYRWTNALWHVGVAACLSPFLLLRTSRSTELSLRMAEPLYRFVAKSGAGFMGMSSDSPSNLRLYIGIPWISFSPLLIGIIKLVSTFFNAVRHPIETIGEIPRNWRRIVLCTDIG